MFRVSQSQLDQEQVSATDDKFGYSVVAQNIAADAPIRQNILVRGPEQQRTNISGQGTIHSPTKPMCKTPPPTATSEEYAFCVACFALVNARKQAFLVCSACQCLRLGKAPTQDEKICGLCLENEKVFAMVPCGHNGVCASCRPKIKRCPWCRDPVNTFLKIYDT